MSTSWRSVYPVHPCAEVFPMMSEQELDALAADIKQNGLHHPVVVWHDKKGKSWVLDGRNRLAALERLGIELRDQGWTDGYVDFGAGSVLFTEGKDISDPATFVISANIRRRHLTKEQQAELIVKTIEAATSTDRATVARSVNRDSNGRLHGREKDPVLTAAVHEGAKHGISKRTIQSARAKVHGKATTKPRHQKKATRRRPAVPPPAPIVEMFDVESMERIREALRAALAKVPPIQRVRCAACLYRLIDELRGELLRETA